MPEVDGLGHRLRESRTVCLVEIVKMLIGDETEEKGTKIIHYYLKYLQTITLILVGLKRETAGLRLYQVFKKRLSVGVEN